MISSGVCNQYVVSSEHALQCVYHCRINKYGASCNDAESYPATGKATSLRCNLDKGAKIWYEGMYLMRVKN